jgi:hypothetical protein
MAMVPAGCPLPHQGLMPLRSSGYTASPGQHHFDPISSPIPQRPTERGRRDGWRSGLAREWLAKEPALPVRAGRARY